VKTIAETLEVARSNIIERQKGDRTARGPQTRPGDAELSADIHRLIDQRPTYGYRRIAALLKRKRRSAVQYQCFRMHRGKFDCRSGKLSQAGFG
jgi:putative transposase